MKLCPFPWPEVGRTWGILLRTLMLVDPAQDFVLPPGWRDSPGLSVLAKEPQPWHRSCALLLWQPAGPLSPKAVSGLALQLEGRGPG